MKMSSRSRNLQSPIRDIIAHAKVLEKTGMKMHYFNIGDPNRFDFDVPLHIKDALIDAVLDKSGHYSSSEGDEELREAITKREKSFNCVDIELSDVIITNGISEAQNALLHTFIEHNKGDEVLLPSPTYPPYLEYTKFAGGIPVEYKMDEENDWQADPDDLRRKISETTKFILIINPNNPCGSMFSKQTLKSIIAIAAEHKLPIVSDEIYDQLVYGDIKHYGTASLTDEVPVIVFNGFSKAYLVPGWRVGYVYFHDPQGALQEIKEGFSAVLRQRLSAATPLMKACARAYDDHRHVEEMCKKLAQRADFAHKRLNEIRGITTNKPKGAFYIFPRVAVKPTWSNDKEFVLDVLKNTGCVFPQGSGFGRYGEDHFRSVVLPTIEEMSEAFDALDAFMRKKIS